MAYATLDDLKLAAPEGDLKDLTDEARTGDVDERKAERAIAKADTRIDSYLRGRYALPLETVPAAIRDISVALALYYLYSNGRPAPEHIKDGYEDAKAELVRIQRGEVNPFPASVTSEPDATRRPGRIRSNKTAADRYFPKDLLSQL
jgi:phage gp36-like protein